MKILSGDILLFHRNSGISKLIQWGTGSIYSHTAICVDPDMCLVIEAQGCVRATDLRKLKEYDVFRIKPDYTYDMEDVVSFLVSKLNSKYDYIGVIFLGLLKLFHLKNTANKWQKKKDYFCSELITEAFAEGGLDIVPNVDEASVTSPGDIAESKVLEEVKEETS